MQDNDRNNALVIDILTYVHAADGLDFTAVDVKLWRRNLPDGLTEDMAMEAVDAARENRPGVYVEPAHITAYWNDIRGKRLRDAGDPPIPGDLTRDQEQAWRAIWCAYARDGVPRDVAALRASADMNLPPEAPAVTAPRAVAELLATAARQYTVPANTGTASGAIIRPGVDDEQ